MATGNEQIGLQRAPKRLEKKYAVVRLYLDDAEEIVALLNGHCERVTIEAEGYTLQNLDALPQIAKDYVRSLRITGWKGINYLTVVLGRSRAYEALSEDDDMVLKGVFSQIDTILIRRAPVERFFAAYPTYYALLSLYILFSCSYTCANIALFRPTIAHNIQSFWNGDFQALQVASFRLTDLVPVALLIALISYGAWFFMTTLQYRSVIYLYPWRQRSSFWERNRDELTRDVIVGVIIALVAAFIGYLIGSQH